ncbi:MAG: hypothetical protein ACRD3L_01225 [Terriglobales bacterium]
MNTDGTVNRALYGNRVLFNGIPAPGLFAQTGTGQGGAAILNQDNSLNTPQSPAARGSTIQIFLTGEATNPAGNHRRSYAIRLEDPSPTCER